jgi:hypothetical protein
MEHHRQQILHVGGVDDFRQQAAGDAARGFGEKAGGRQQPRGYIQRNLLALAKQGGK